MQAVLRLDADQELTAFLTPWWWTEQWDGREPTPHISRAISAIVAMRLDFRRVAISRERIELCVPVDDDAAYELLVSRLADLRVFLEELVEPPRLAHAN